MRTTKCVIHKDHDVCNQVEDIYFLNNHRSFTIFPCYFYSSWHFSIDWFFIFLIKLEFYSTVNNFYVLWLQILSKHKMFIFYWISYFMVFTNHPFCCSHVASYVLHFLYVNHTPILSFKIDHLLYLMKIVFSILQHYIPIEIFWL